MKELYQEYKQLLKATQPLQLNEKQALVALTLTNDWKYFIKMLDNWKYLIAVKGFTSGKGEKDFISIQTQLKMIAILKTFQNKYKHLYELPKDFTDENSATTVEL